MENAYFWAAVAVSAGITFLLRALPFVIFNGKRKMPDALVRLGQLLPPAIMAVLIVYCLKDGIMDLPESGIAQAVAVAVVAVSYKWKHNTMLGIAAGTAAYMVLIRIL